MEVWWTRVLILCGEAMKFNHLFFKIIGESTKGNSNMEKTLAGTFSEWSEVNVICNHN